MKASWLAEFKKDLGVNGALPAGVVGMEIYHRHKEVWYAGSQECGQQEFLKKAISEASHLKCGKQKKYAFPVHDVDVVVELTFDVFPKSGKLANLRKAIDQIKDGSQHRFDALHDSLTGCKNRKSFDKAIIAAVDEMSVLSISDDASSLKQGGAPSVSLLTADIDFFKRINDSRGHDYGDAVLRAFAWNIQDFCEAAEREALGVSYSLFRLGGEEFNVLIAGAISEQEVLAFAESLRRMIESSVTPSDAQVEIFSGGIAFSDLNVPDANERRVTASFGISRSTGFLNEKGRQRIVDELKTQADKALYSAKNSGRNRVRYFPDIIKKYGRVLQYDKETRVVIIDIGSEVGVVRGREFFVVPEKYTGEIDYVVDDGRSQRKLGRYPRIKIAKTVAFNVQAEISFCSIAEQNDGVEITAGALVESIPLGLFGGLSGSHAYNESPAEADAKLALKKWISDANWVTGRIVALRFPGIRDVEKKYGSVKANEILAGAAAAAKKLLPTPVKVLQTEVGQFGIAFYCEDERVQPLVEALVAALHDLCVDVVDFSVGVAGRSAIEDVGADEYSLDITSAYDYATIAAAASDTNSWRLFDSEAPVEVIRRSESEKEFDKVIADYTRFKDLGIVGASFENRAGISYFATGMLEDANICFRAAIEYLDEDAVVRSNYAITQFMLGKSVEAFDQLALAEQLDREYPRDNVRALYAVASLDSFLSKGQPGIEVVLEIFNAADTLESKSFLRPGVYERARLRAHSIFSDYEGGGRV